MTATDFLNGMDGVAQAGQVQKIEPTSNQFFYSRERSQVSRPVGVQSSPVWSTWRAPVPHRAGEVYQRDNR
jgi:hypothetical protein